MKASSFPIITNQKEMEENSTMKSSRRRILVVPAPFEDHRPPMMQLAAALYSKGFSITVAQTQFNFVDISNHFPHFQFLTIADGLSESDASSLGLVSFLLKLNVICERLLKESLVRLIQQADPDDVGEIACVIYDEFLYFPGRVAEQVNLRSIVFSISSATTSVSRSVLIRVKKDGLLPPKESELQEELVTGFHHPFRFKDLPTTEHGSLDNLLQLYENMSYRRTTSAVVFNTTDCLDNLSLIKLDKDWQLPTFPVGPLHKVSSVNVYPNLLVEEESCTVWLSKQKPKSVVYISLGSLAKMQENELEELAWGLANSKQPFLWVIRPGSIPRSEWNELLPDGFKEAVAGRGCIVKWAPQREVLGHPAVGGFWSHCGWNSTVESITEGVPMICRPYSGDQKGIARLWSHVWGIGIQIEGELERGKVERAVRRLMVDKEGEEMRKKVMELKDKVEASVRIGGSSYNSLNKLAELIMSC